MAKVNSSDFGKAVKVRLIELDKTQDWLAQNVASRTGMYFDTSYLWKVLNGVLNPPKIIEAIRDILDLPEEDGNGGNECAFDSIVARKQSDKTDSGE